MNNHKKINVILYSKSSDESDEAEEFTNRNLSPEDFENIETFSPRCSEDSQESFIKTLQKQGFDEYVNDSKRESELETAAPSKPQVPTALLPPHVAAEKNSKEKKIKYERDFDSNRNKTAGKEVSVSNPVVPDKQKKSRRKSRNRWANGSFFGKVTKRKKIKRDDTSDECQSLSAASNAPNSKVLSEIDNQVHKQIDKRKSNEDEKEVVYVKRTSNNIGLEPRVILNKEKLLDIYKCSSKKCVWTSSNQEHFKEHIKLHESNQELDKDYLKCVYCFTTCSSYESLFAHIQEEHINCRFCCKYCFYRAVVPSYVEIHQKINHPIFRVEVFTQKSLPRLLNTIKSSPSHVTIKSYICINSGCHEPFLNPQVFKEHLNTTHADIKNNFACHACEQHSSTVEELLKHYEIHGYYRYHCKYCSHGSDSMEGLHNHLSTLHYNKPPHIFERCLPKDIPNGCGHDLFQVHNLEAVFRKNNLIKDTVDDSKENNGTHVSNISQGIKDLFSQDNTDDTVIDNAELRVSNHRLYDSKCKRTHKRKQPRKFKLGKRAYYNFDYGEHAWQPKRERTYSSSDQPSSTSSTPSENKSGLSGSSIDRT